MKAIRNSMLCLWSFAALSSCATTTRTPQKLTQNSQGVARKQGLAKEGQKASISKTLNTTAPVASLPKTAQESSSALSPEKLLEHLADPSLPVPDAELQEAANSAGSPPGSLGQAIFIAGQLRLMRLDLEHQSGFQEKDPQGPEHSNNAAPQNLPSLEKRFQDLQVDFVTALSQNPHLKQPSLLSMTEDLLDRTQNSVAFHQSLAPLLRSPVDTKNVVPANQVSTSSEVLPAAANTPAPKEETARPSVPEYAENNDIKTAMNDLKKSDVALLFAQKLADKGDYKQAIDQVEKIERTDPFYELAKEKQKSFSNLAVQDLRKQAAEAFQNAMPIREPRAKLAYLNQARDLLEKALKDFPVADQLDRVRENLNVINRDLSLLEQEISQNSPSSN